MNPLNKLFAELGALVAVFVLGMVMMRGHMTGEIQELKDQYAVALQLSTHAKDLADQRAKFAEENQATAINAAVDAYRSARKDEKAHDDIVIADLRGDVTRLRVRTNRPACGSGMPETPASAGRPADAGNETLAGSVAARLAGRYADYNGIVDKLTLCQAVVKADRATLQ